MRCCARVLGETRHRSIVEKTIGASPGLNPNFLHPPDQKKRNDELRAEIMRRIEKLAAYKKANESLPSKPEDDKAAEVPDGKPASA